MRNGERELPAAPIIHPHSTVAAIEAVATGERERERGVAAKRKATTALSLAMFCIDTFRGPLFGTDREDEGRVKFARPAIWET